VLSLIQFTQNVFSLEWESNTIAQIMPNNLGFRSELYYIGWIPFGFDSIWKWFALFGDGKCIQGTFL
jgi:hypothetical protein